MGLYLLLSPLLLVIAVIFKIYSPKNINHYFGYRTQSSMASEQAWEISNDYSSKLLVLVAIVLNILQLILFLWIDREVAFLIVGGLMIVGVLLIIPFTERHLRKNHWKESFHIGYKTKYDSYAITDKLKQIGIECLIFGPSLWWGSYCRIHLLIPLYTIFLPIGKLYF